MVDCGPPVNCFVLDDVAPQNGLDTDVFKQETIYKLFLNGPVFNTYVETKRSLVVWCVSESHQNEDSSSLQVFVPL